MLQEHKRFILRKCQGKRDSTHTNTHALLHKNKHTTVADPGFSLRGCANSQKCYYFSIFFPKSAWKWKNLDPQGARPSCPSLGSTIAPAADTQEIYSPTFSSGGSKGGARDARPPGVKILSISCSFWENLVKLYVGAPRGVGAPSSGKSWIRHCKQQFSPLVPQCNTYRPSGGHYSEAIM